MILGYPAGIPQFVKGSGNRAWFTRSMFFLYKASHSSLYGGCSRTPGEPAAPLGLAVAGSKRVAPVATLPGTAQTPVQSGSDCPKMLAGNTVNITAIKTGMTLFIIMNLSCPIKNFRCFTGSTVYSAVSWATKREFTNGGAAVM